MRCFYDLKPRRRQFNLFIFAKQYEEKKTPEKKNENKWMYVISKFDGNCNLKQQQNKPTQKIRKRMNVK